MEDLLTEKEFKVAHSIIEKGLKNAATSLSHFTKSSTHFELNKPVTVSEKFSEDYVSEKGEELYLLTSELMGELSGVSYLIFSLEEVKVIMKAIYPNKDFDDEKYKKRAKNLTLELDNIITAGVVSEFSNAFGYMTYGGVPKLDIVTREEAIGLIKDGFRSEHYILDFKAQLMSEEMDFNADFIWSVNTAFIDGVKKIG